MALAPMLRMVGTETSTGGGVRICLDDVMETRCLDALGVGSVAVAGDTVRTTDIVSCVEMVSVSVVVCC